MGTIRKIVEGVQFPMLTLVAGHNGTYRRVTGINVVESIDLIMFCRPNELVVTTGINLSSGESLEQLVKLAFAKKVAGFIINAGPYIPNIPESVTSFANEHDFPIFHMPWNYRIADLLKTTFQFIANHHQELSIEEKVLYNLLFHYKQNANYIKDQLALLGFPQGRELAIISCTTNSVQTNIDRYEVMIQFAFQNRYKRFLKLKHKNHLIFLIDKAQINTPNTPFSKIVEEIYDKITQKNGYLDIIIGKGNYHKELENVRKSYDESLTVIQLAKLHNNRFLYKYKEIGAYKIIMAVQNQTLIKSYSQDILGQLYRYDELHNTDYVQFLRIFLEENGSTRRISERQFIHRNTVLYKIKKIETLLDMDLSNPFTKTNLYIAFLIEDVLAHQ
ncbi:PucR family transcriptional regulator ligand-binding domain-containing protein [Lysinibacillus xylanilyticus]|uniref:PucR family transcriptional regulator n=1 Tax=Lysinibacillus xylanilyticus TaxID=582475 RepID=UPI002B2466AB|nr:PucR family transcriptional regulator ligand-binding domain-containing protein [Lysinibacillus xylanilyticus]MEB2300987.1 PucR family transcriptional regulator ligand-binding domain-containing protein [Lysinibacillus xylanilyticus]